tara:strand:+ start:1915 stop:2634 length:720 start_codon:yes stop_codon:yes gene_type:complete
MINKNITFIIPAAGQSTRFKSNRSKIFFKYKNKPLIEHIINKCFFYAKKILIVSNKKNLNELKYFVKKKKFKNIGIVLQNSPKGMGHAVNLALKKVNTKFSAVIWSDQIYLKKQTIKKTIQNFLKKKYILSFPVYKKKNPYVVIVKDKKNNFIDVIQTRETKFKIKRGYSDCGFFLFKTNVVKKTLKILISKNLLITKKTREIDFLKSFKYLNKIGKIGIVKATNYRDTIGVNFLKDLI